MDKQEQLDALNKLYMYYACVADDTIDNFLKALHYRRQIGLLKGDLKILNEVKETYDNIEKARKTTIKHRNRESML
jgi:hypothetical protein